MNKNKSIILSIIIAILLISGLVYGYIINREGEIKEEEITDWCIPGTNITAWTEEINVTEEYQNFEIKGNTTYKGREVCQAEYKYDEGSLIQYFTKKKDYIAFVYKDSYGNIVNEIEMNESSFDEVNNDNINYENYYDNEIDNVEN